jgi:hypothetical protein
MCASLSWNEIAWEEGINDDRFDGGLAEWADYG